MLCSELSNVCALTRYNDVFNLLEQNVHTKQLITHANSPSRVTPRMRILLQTFQESVSDWSWPDVTTMAHALRSTHYNPYPPLRTFSATSLQKYWLCIITCTSDLYNQSLVPNFDGSRCDSLQIFESAWICVIVFSLWSQKCQQQGLEFDLNSLNIKNIYFMPRWVVKI